MLYVFWLTVTLLLPHCLSYSTRVREDLIIKLTESKSRGASFLRRLRVASASECARTCATLFDCDTAIYHKHALAADVSKSNCYHLKCDRPTRCVFTSHPSYTVIEKIDDETSTTPPPPPIDCVTSAWIAVSQCSVTCGVGSIVYQRTIEVPSRNGGRACPSEMKKTETCLPSPCPVDCIVSEWKSFGPCSVSCGGGWRRRNRTILTEAAFGGNPCPESGDLIDVEACSSEPCPVNELDVEDELEKILSEEIILEEITTVSPHTVTHHPSSASTFSDDIDWKSVMDDILSASLEPSSNHEIASHADILEATETPSLKNSTESPTTSSGSSAAAAATTVPPTTRFPTNYRSSQSQEEIITISATGATRKGLGLAESSGKSASHGIGGGLVAAFVISLCVGILFVVAALAFLVRNWYGGFRWRRRYSRMEYLINDLDDDD